MVRQPEPVDVNRIDAAGNILTKNLASATANPTHIVGGPEGALWFTEGVANAIGRMPATTPLAVPDESRTTEEGPNAIAAGSDGNLWFTEYSASKIGRMTPSGETTYFPLPKGIENPEGIAAGPDGALWYTALNPPTVVRIATDGAQQPFPLPKEKFPDEIAAGPDGALWFAAGGEIGRITTGGEVELFPLPKGVGLNYVTPGPDGNVWFTEENAGRIGRITTPPNATTVGAGEVKAGAGEGRRHGRRPLTADRRGRSSTGRPAPLRTTRHRSILRRALRTSRSRSPSADCPRAPPTATGSWRRTRPGTTSGAFAEFTTGPPPKCRIKKAKLGTSGTLTVPLTCTATSSISAAARFVSPKKSAKQSRSSLFGRGHAKVVKGKATLRIKPKKAARKQLRRHSRLSIRLAMKLRGGGAITGYNKIVHVRRPKPTR